MCSIYTYAFVKYIVFGVFHPLGVYAAVDIYGQCVEVDMCYDDHSGVTEESVTATPTPTVDAVVSTHQFHEHCGRNIRLTDSRTVASRINSYDYGIAFSSRRLSNDELFEVHICVCLSVCLCMPYTVIHSCKL